MSSKFNYSLRSGNNKLEIVFAENARFQTIEGEYTRVRGMLNALTNIAGERGYQFIQDGIVLNSAPGAYKGVFEEVDAGYADGRTLEMLVKAGLVGRSKAIKADDVYRLRWNGFSTFTALHLAHRAYTEGEPSYMAHNRNAIYLFQAYQMLFRAQQLADAGTPVNFRLIWTNRFESRANHKLELLGLNGKEYTPEEIRQDVELRLQNVQVRNTLKKAQARKNKPEVDAGDFLREYVGADEEAREIQALSLVGCKIAWWGAAGRCHNITTVTAENLTNIVKTARSRGLKVEVVEAAS